MIFNVVLHDTFLNHHDDQFFRATDLVFLLIFAYVWKKIVLLSPKRLQFNMFFSFQNTSSKLRVTYRSILAFFLLLPCSIIKAIILYIRLDLFNNMFNFKHFGIHIAKIAFVPLLCLTFRILSFLSKMNIGTRHSSLPIIRNDIKTLIMQGPYF